MAIWLYIFISYLPGNAACKRPKCLLSQYIFFSRVQAQLIDDALDLAFDGLRTNTKEHMRKVPLGSDAANVPV